MSSPGWYRDPDGRPTLRWWDGSAWADLTVDPPPGQPPSEPEPVQASPDELPRRSRRPLLLGVGALAVIVLLLVVGVLVSRPDDHQIAAVSTPGPITSPAPQPTTPSSPGTTIAPGTTRIVDTAAGISYPYLGSDWKGYDLGGQQETTATTGQYLVTQEDAPGGGDYYAQCTSGPLDSLFGYASTSSLQVTAHLVAYEAGLRNYPYPNQQQDAADEAVTIDGHSGWLYQFSLSWQVAGYDATSEQVALLLVDVGTAAPALLYVSIPNTRREGPQEISTVLAGVHVP